jgi:carbon-monoxide dehydrogenase medium subunit
MYGFELVTPKSVDEAVAALAGEDAQALGGGQTLIPTMKQRLASPATLVSLRHIPELRFVRREGDRLRIGGGTTHGQIMREAKAHYPALADQASHIGDPAVRSLGTIGGSLANNDPSACYPAAVLASGATVVTNAREIGAEEFFQGLFTTALEEGEIITEVRFPVPERGHYAKFVQPASRFALVAVFVAKFPQGVRVAVTGASERGVFRWSEAEEALSADFRPEAVEGLRASAEGMIGDLHGTPEYRAHLIGVMTRRAAAAS